MSPHRRRAGPALFALCVLTAACANPAAETADAPTTAVSSTTALTTTEPTTTSSSSTGPASTVAPDLQQIPSSAEEIAAELSAAEAAVRNSGLAQEKRQAWGRRQQRLYRHLAVNEELVAPVLTAISSEYAPAVQLNWTARKELSALGSSGPLSTVLPAWRIRDPLPAEELLGYYEAAEAATGIEWEYLAAINLVETRMGRIEGLSTAGATGPMQFLPSTWAECCQGDPTIDRDAILGAATYLRHRGGPDDMERSLKGYNNSGYYVRAVSAYAQVLRADPEAYWGYHAWEVFFRSEAGLVRIPTGYNEPEAIDAAEWIAANPQHVIG